MRIKLERKISIYSIIPLAQSFIGFICSKLRIKQSNKFIMLFNQRVCPLDKNLAIIVERRHLKIIIEGNQHRKTEMLFEINLMRLFKFEMST